MAPTLAAPLLANPSPLSAPPLGTRGISCICFCHMRTRFFALFARVLSVVFLRISLTNRPIRVCWNEKKITNWIERRPDAFCKTRPHTTFTSTHNAHVSVQGEQGTPVVQNQFYSRTMNDLCNELWVKRLPKLQNSTQRSCVPSDTTEMQWMLHDCPCAELDVAFPTCPVPALKTLNIALTSRASFVSGHISNAEIT